MANELQISAPTSLTLYGVFINPAGKWYNTVTPGFETYNAADWADYVVTLVESVANTGFYVGSVPSSLAAAGLYFFSVYNQAGSSPAATDIQQGLTLVLDWSGTAVNSIAPIPVGPGNTQAAQIPQEQNSLQYAQTILNQLYSAMSQLLATGSFLGIESIKIDGQETTFTSTAQITRLIQFWERKVALLAGTRKRVSRLGLGGYFGSGWNWPGYWGG